MTLNRTALSVVILVAIMVAIGWLVMSPTQNDTAGGSTRTTPANMQPVPNNPGPTVGTP